jgi:hypothetical protein
MTTIDRRSSRRLSSKVTCALRLSRKKLVHFRVAVVDTEEPDRTAPRTAGIARAKQPENVDDRPKKC